MSTARMHKSLDEWRQTKADVATAASLLPIAVEDIGTLWNALVAAEAAMTRSPAFNKWDLGPTEPLKAVRRVLAKAGAL